MTGYYQLASMANYFVRAIGWTPGSGALAALLPMPVLANVPLLNNAFFSPPSAAWPAYMAFGDEFDPPGINDFLRDPTIPRHEFTHAIVYDRGSASVKYGPVVMPMTPGKRLTLRNRFPLPLGDAHFYYFQPPAGATRVTIDDATVSGTSTIPSDLRYCGTVSVTGTTFPAELNNVSLWLYDPAQPVLPFALTPLDLVQHQLASAVPAKGPTRRRLPHFTLPPSPTGVYAVSLQGSGRYRVKLSFN